MRSIRKQLLDIFAGDEPEYERAAALGFAALPVLAEMVNEDIGVASSAVYVAGLIAAHESVDIIARAARSDDPDLRTHAAGALRQFVSRTHSSDNLDAAAEILAPLLDDQDVCVRKFAQRAAAAFPDGARHPVGRHASS